MADAVIDADHAIRKTQLIRDWLAKRPPSQHCMVRRQHPTWGAYPYQHAWQGRTPTAPPSLAAGTRAVSATASSSVSASNTMYPRIRRLLRLRLRKVLLRRWCHHS